MTPPAEDPKKLVIVVADDDVDTLNIVKVKLEAYGLRVVTVRDGQAALATVRQHRPAIVILDVMMPRLNGFQVARMIKFDKRLKPTPVLLLTARTQQTDKDMGRQVGADEYITKPFDPQQLLERVNYWLKRQKEITTAGTPS